MRHRTLRGSHLLPNLLYCGPVARVVPEERLGAEGGEAAWWVGIGYRGVRPTWAVARACRTTMSF